MLKTILICVLLLSVFGGHVRKTHKDIQNKKARKFNSAFFEFQNLGEKDYHLSAKEAQHWAHITSDVDSTTKGHKSFIESKLEYIPGVVGNVVDLSKNVGVYSYTVTDLNGNILETETGDHLANKLNTAYLEMTSKIQDSTSLNLQDNNQQ
ncbi:unnamed protein product [Paramecium sonneborni]|uniref:Uncharacterized protein n=1 Tax=Paramecium sonneborni TaxID=65129 RepID=A0A8S1L593_9CILI|nr:unnamed protein product [Paramecium sonneborni]CAD8060742.1 unnamed protein product [Paramecium sonneborni]